MMMQRSGKKKLIPKSLPVAKIWNFSQNTFWFSLNFVFECEGHLIFLLRNVNDAQENVLTLLQSVRLEQPDHQLGYERDGYQ